MGAIVLVTLALVEIVMLVASIKTRASSKKWLQMRTTVSVCEAVALALLMALHVSNMAFDFRWTALLVVLVLRSAISLVVFLVRRNKASESAPHCTARMVLNVIGSIVVVAVAAVPALVFPHYGGLPTTGGYSVNEAHAIMVDETRTDPFEHDGSYREIPVWFYYPTVSADERNTFPLVIFSHGAFGYHESNYSLYAELASNGYVVAALDYPHHAFFAPDTQGKTVLVDQDFLANAIATQNGELSDDESYALTREWMQLRTSDLAFALDAIEAAAHSGSLDDGTWYFETEGQRTLTQDAFSLCDVEKVGLVGHSMGGATSVCIGRVRTEVRAVIDLDGTMFTEYERNDGGTYSFVEDPYPVPLLSVDSERHYLSGMEARQMGETYVNNVVLDNAKVAAHTYFKGSSHMNLTDLPLFSPTLASLLDNSSADDIDARECIEQVNALVLSWFDEYLKGEGKATIAESY